MTKELNANAEIARRLLGTATHLFAQDLDPVSVHCLACSAAEHAALISQASTGRTFNDHVQAVFPDRELKTIRKIRNQYWNPIKHAKDHSGQERRLAIDLEGFNDLQNDHMLFVVWFDYMNGGRGLPLAAQVFLAWYYDLYPEKISPLHLQEVGHEPVFPDLPSQSRKTQKRWLRSATKFYQNNDDIMRSPQTDTRPLVLQYWDNP
ncbi:hypothetical protein [Shimia ponticola]|uniref:hypothetical protein n=1 Tax=Shimia ponticola TaxID=2582893 RepID=UPI0011BDC933|nr:hypothetical protein [Shimia ponticola]